MIRQVLPLCGAALLAGCAAQVADGGRFLAGGAPVGDYAVALKPMQDTRFTGVIRQEFDFSCGSAALATLLRYHYGYAVREENAFRGMWAKGDQAQIRKVGFSLLDMKRWLASRGLTAEGYEVDLGAVAKTGIPGIALLKVKNYRHFVVVKGIRGREVLLGDPSLGVTVMPIDTFREAWNGIYFVLTGEQERGKRGFDRDAQWAAYARAPIGKGLADPVSQQALMLTAPFYGDIS